VLVLNPSTHGKNTVSGPVFHSNLSQLTNWLLQAVIHPKLILDFLISRDRACARKKSQSGPFSAIVVRLLYSQPNSDKGRPNFLDLGYFARGSETSTRTCNSDENDPVYSNFVIYDPLGTAHPLNTNFTYDGDGCVPVPAGAQSIDGSGLSVVTGGSTTTWNWTVYDRYGNALTTSPPNYTATTPSGVKASYTFNNDTDYIYTDPWATSASAPFMIFTPGEIGNTEKFGQDKYAYTDAGGNTQQYLVNYSTFTLITTFACPVISDFPATSVTLPTSISIPGGASYSFSYEVPYGKTSPYTTGRISKITYPAGGYTFYTYSGTNGNGGTGGIDCNSYGIVPQLTRTVFDNNGNSAQWTIKNGGTAHVPFTVTEIDPSSNYTVYSFWDEYPTTVKSYQGSATGTPLKTVSYCYWGQGLNSNTGNCAATPSIIPPFGEVDMYMSTGTSAVSKVKTTFDTFGNVTGSYVSDFGASVPTRQTLITYGTWNGSSCVALSGQTVSAFIVGTPCDVKVENSSGAPIKETRMSYDGYGRPTVQYNWVSGTNFLHSSATFNSNGTVANATDANGTISSYGYNGTDGCNSLLPTSVTSVGLSTTLEWDCNGAVVTQTTDANLQQTEYAYNDPLWRLKSMTDAQRNITNYNYSTPTTFESVLNFNGTISTADTLITSDGLSRPTFRQTRQGQGLPSFDTTQTVYGFASASTGACTTQPPFKTGACTTVAIPYSGSAGQSAPSGTPATTSQQDALGRPLIVTDGGGTVSYQYIQNDVLQTIGPAPSGENTKMRQLEYNALGQLTSVCEVTSAAGSGAGSCGQSNPEIGLLTKYTYDAVGNLLTVYQNAQQGAIGGTQTRTYTYDGLTRLTSESNPETGATAYTYDTDATCGTSRGDLVKHVDANGNTVCDTYDGLHRVTSTTFSGPNATSNRYFVYDAATVDGQSMANAKGRLAEAYTASTASGTKITDEGYSYTARGELSNFYESTPNSSEYYSVPLSYWANGQTQTFGPFLNEAQVSITPDGEGRPFTISPGAGNILYNSASLPTQLQVSCAAGTCYPIGYQYDPNTLRMTQYSFAGSNGTLSGTLSWNSNGSLGQLVVADPVNFADPQTCNYNADDLARIASVSCNSGTTWGQQFSYDAFGNITKTVPSGATGVSWMPGYTASTNHYSLGGSSYDSNGNVLNDSFNSYTWDAEGKVLSTVFSGGQTWSYTYDAFGHVVELAINGAYQHSYLKLGSFRLSAIGQTAYYSETPLPAGSVASQNAGDTGIQIADWLGTIRGNSSYSGGFLNNTLSRAPFGEAYAIEGGAGEAFAGQEGDNNRSGTIYWFPERQYVTTQGRFLSPDPAGLAAVNPANPQSWNRYAYVGNSPLSNVDPAGLCPSGSYNAGPNGWDAASGTNGCGGIGVNAPVVDWVWANGEWLGLDGWSTWDGLIQRGPIQNSILTGEDSPFSGSLQSQIAGLLGGIMPCETEFGAPCVAIGSTFTTVPGYQPLTASQLAYLEDLQGMAGLFWDVPGPPRLCRSFQCNAATISGPQPAVFSAINLPTEEQVNAMCSVYAINANNGFGDAAADSANASIWSGTKFEQYTQYPRPTTMNPSAPTIMVLAPLAAPSIYIQASYNNCKAALGY
jgi:RHS repeat-associated protein